MLTRLKAVHIALAIFLMFSLISPFAPKVEAYGLIYNHEKVIDAGKEHFVVLKEDGSVWSWGDNEYGQMGSQSFVPTDSLAPIPIKKADGNRLLNVKAIAAGGYHSVALVENADTGNVEVWTWGSNIFGQLGHSVGSRQNENPTKVEGLPSNIKAIAAGDYHTLAVDDTGQVWAWGYNKYGQLGVDLGAGINYTEDPQRVAGATNVIAVAAGSDHSIALKKDGTVIGWGRNTFGQLGNGQTTDKNDVPQPVYGLTNIMEIAAGDNHTIALSQDRSTVWAWGSNYYGQLGDGGKDNKLYPIKVQDIQDINMIAAGDNHTIALKNDGTVWMWGRNTSGTQTSRSTPILVKGISNAVSIGGGGAANSYTLTVTQDGKVWLWDKTSSDTTTKEPIFKQVSGIDNVMNIAQFPFVQGSQVLFRFYGDNNTQDVKINGSFNDWVELPLKEVSNNVWELQVTLKPGEYDYGFYVNGRWTLDSLNRNKSIDDFGNPFSVLKVMPYATEGPIINGKNVTFTYSSFDYSGALELNAETSYVAVVGNFSDWQEIPLEKQPNNIWAVTKTLEPGDYYYSFIVRDLSVGKETEKRNDPLNNNIESNPITGVSRNTFHVSELLPNAVPVTGISLNKGPLLDMVVGEQGYVSETVTPSNASNKNVNWTSSNPNVVNVGADGKLTAIAKGTAVIVCTTVDGGKTATMTVTVNEQDNAVSYPRVGYEEFSSHTGVIPSKVWKVKFTQPVDRSSVVPNSVYILNESGIKIPLAYILQKDEKTLEIRLADGFKYQQGATYYLFIEDTVKAKYGGELGKPIQMKFTIQL